MEQNSKGTGTPVQTGSGRIPKMAFLVLAIISAVALIALSAFNIVQGIMYLVAIYFPDLAPDWIPSILEGNVVYQSLIADSSIIRIVLGGATCLAGLAPLSRKQWGMAIGITVCSILLAIYTPGLISVLSWAAFQSWPALVQVIATAIPAFGIVWMLVARKSFS